MKTATPLTEAEQLAAIRSALRLLDAGNPHQAQIDLCDAVLKTLPDARCFKALATAANGLDIGMESRTVLINLATALLELDRAADPPKMTAAEHGAFHGGRW